MKCGQVPLYWKRNPAHADGSVSQPASTSRLQPVTLLVNLFCRCLLRDPATSILFNRASKPVYLYVCQHLRTPSLPLVAAIDLLPQLRVFNACFWIRAISPDSRLLCVLVRIALIKMHAQDNFASRVSEHDPQPFLCTMDKASVGSNAYTGLASIANDAKLFNLIRFLVHNDRFWSSSAGDGPIWHRTSPGSGNR